MNLPERVKLSDVAAQAGVSAATVSRVLNQSANVSSSVRERVLAAVESLGYEKSAGPDAPTLAVLITDLLNPFFPELVRGMQDEARLDGLGLLLYDTAEGIQSEAQILNQIARRSPDGLIVCASRLSTQELTAFHTRSGLPTVLINRSSGDPQMPCVLTDFFDAASRACTHLLDLGHTRIAYLAGPGESETSLLRRSGIEAALTRAGLTLPEVWRPSSFPNVAGGFQAMSALLSGTPTSWPSAVIAYNDSMALGALNAIRGSGLHVPEDISVVGYDDIAMAAHANPPLTTIAQPKAALGRLAVQLIRRLMNGQPHPGGSILLESPLIVRASTGRAPIH